MSLIDHAREEAAHLESRLATLRKFIADYGGNVVSAVAAKAVASTKSKASAKKPDVSSKDDILAKAESFLRGLGRPAFAKDILPEIEKAGISLGNGGARHLGKLLSRAKDRFTYSKEHGFNLPTAS